MEELASCIASPFALEAFCKVKSSWEKSIATSNFSQLQDYSWSKRTDSSVAVNPPPLMLTSKRKDDLVPFTSPILMLVTGNLQMHNYSVSKLQSLFDVCAALHTLLPHYQLTLLLNKVSHVSSKSS